MVGLCGVVGDRKHDTDWMADDLKWTGDEESTKYSDRHLALHHVSHAAFEPSEPIEVGDDALLWVHGNVYGFDGADGYRSRRETDMDTATEYCAHLYEKHGTKFVRSLNGTFLGVLYDREERTVHIFIDRLGSRPVYYARPDRRTVLFSTNVQSLPCHPDVDPAFDRESLYEYFSLAHVSGLRTAFEAARELPPSSITTIDIGTGDIETERYWQPIYRPLDRPFSYFVDQFVNRFRAALDDRLDRDREYGLLLSGGSDSRAILAGADVDLTAYHSTGWVSREARTAERAALTANADFRLLRRDEDYQQRVLERTAPIQNLQGWFAEAHLAGFSETLREEVDVMISGLYADALCSKYGLNRPRVSLGPFGVLRVPIANRATSVEDYIDRQAEEPPAYLRTPPRLREILDRNTTQQRNGVVHGGVEYPSIRELALYGDCYPLSNDPDFFYRSLTQTMPHRTPFLDNRLIDLSLRLPVKYRVRRDLVNAAITVLDPELAEIPHATTGVPLDRSFPVNYLQQQWKLFVRKFVLTDEPPKPHLRHGPWTDHEELIRSHSFVIDTIHESEELIRELPFLRWEGVLDCYRDHLAGADNTNQLYTLLSFLRMPVTRQAISGPQPVHTSSKAN